MITYTDLHQFNSAFAWLGWAASALSPLCWSGTWQCKLQWFQWAFGLYSQGYPFVCLYVCKSCKLASVTITIQYI